MWTISSSATPLNYSSCNSIVSELAQKVEVVNNGEVRSFLDISVTRNYSQQAISIAQPGYMDPPLAKYNLLDAKLHIYFDYTSNQLNSTSTSKPRCMIYDASNQLAIIVLSTYQMRTSTATRTTENPTLATCLLSTAAQ
jgi:hypothetical protein